MRICIDPGHRNTTYDFGATACNIKESEISLQIAKIVADGFKKAGHEVFFTRTNENQVISLSKRIKEANKIANLDYYLSIHINSATNLSAKGFEVWHYGDSKELADSICENVCIRTNQRNRGQKVSTGYAVLKDTYCKSFIIECGFISNNEERSQLLKSDFQNQIASGILKSFGINYNTSQSKDDKLSIILNGVIKKVDYLEKDGANYVKLRDLKDAYINVDYDTYSKMPIINVKE